MTIYGEGRCKLCGYRVTVERGSAYHRGPDGRLCGPVETEHPFEARDIAPRRPGPVS